MDVKDVNFLLVGVGGQGTILASNVLAEVGLEAGYDVKKAEVHGMAQRGGSVTSHVRWGRAVRSPIIGAGEADVLLAFEKLEAVRYAENLRPGGLALVSDHAIPPVSVSSGNDVYPADEKVRSVLQAVTDDVCFVPAVAEAQALGNARVHNIVLLGALSQRLEVPADLWERVIAAWVPERHRDLNVRAFRRGRELAL
ncbi:MAG: indolepyruvate oxidoreductase subunit beta [Anaerolineae bacterium]